MCQSKVHNLYATKCHKLFFLFYKVNFLLSAVHFILENKVSQAHNGVESPLWFVGGLEFLGSDAVLSGRVQSCAHRESITKIATL